MVYEIIKSWYYLQPQEQVGHTALVLHTSSVNYSQEDFLRLSTIPFIWIIPDNVYWELKLLSESKLFGAKASFILSKVMKDVDWRRQKFRKGWDLEQLYKGCSEPVAPSEIFDGTLLFVFGDLGKQDEFIRHHIGLDNHYILLNEGWSCIKGQARVYGLRQIGRLEMRKARPLMPGASMPLPRELTEINVPDYGMVFSGKDLKATNKYGSNAGIYTCRKFAGQYIKIYKNQDQRGHQKKKLENLQYISRQVKHRNLALPESVLYNGAGHVVGYTMKRCSGQPLRDYLPVGWEGHDLAVIFRRLSLLLLELHTMHIIANDLSFNNIIIGEGDEVSLVDCDSFQVFDYPGGGITEMYRHPEISVDQCQKTLREPRHEYFSFAVVLFQCLFYYEPLWQVQEGEDEYVLNWNNVRFPLDVDGRSQRRANRDILRLWEGQPETVQKMFADEFHFRRNHSIGAWVRALELL